MTLLHAIPTNVITGFLGAGKSTAILNLLAAKPKEERWAVLVNEFGEVGIDGSLLSGRAGEEQGVFVREVPGGCMCCTAGLPMQMALNMLLTRAMPDRLLIEPTGLGHPNEVLAVLRNEHYQDVLDLRSTLTLIDARKVQDPRYAEHPTFQQQLAIADVIVASKSDQYGPEDYPGLLKFLTRIDCSDGISVKKISHGRLAMEWLAEEAKPPRHQARSSPYRSDELNDEIPSPNITPESGYLSIDNAGEGFHSRGWVFAPDQMFNAGSLRAALSKADAERIKGVFVTDAGVIGFNSADGVLTEIALDDCMDSRVECITRDQALLDGLGEALLDCIL